MNRSRVNLLTSHIVARVKLEQAYPRIAFRWRSRNWWARLTRVPPECEHLEHGAEWMATYAPDTLYLRGKASLRRRPARPEVSLCRACLLSELETELSGYHGRVVAFEPDGAGLHAIFLCRRGGVCRRRAASRRGFGHRAASRTAGGRLRRVRRAGRLALDFARAGREPR